MEFSPFAEPSLSEMLDYPLPIPSLPDVGQIDVEAQYWLERQRRAHEGGTTAERFVADVMSTDFAHLRLFQPQADRFSRFIEGTPDTGEYPWVDKYVATFALS